MSDPPAKSGSINNVKEFPVNWREIRLPRWASPNDEFIAIPVPDNSLQAEHIIKGDLAIVHLTATIRPGDPIVVFTRQGDTLSRFDKNRPEGAIRGKIIRIERDL
jgi:SOS-response transcriptional repressor LexA